MNRVISSVAPIVLLASTVVAGSTAHAGSYDVVPALVSTGGAPAVGKTASIDEFYGFASSGGLYYLAYTAIEGGESVPLVSALDPLRPSPSWAGWATHTASPVT